MTLSAGDIAFVGFNADGTDNIAFVALADIGPGEVVYFEDNEWNGTGWADTNEGAFSWTATSLVPAGTVVLIDNIGSGTITASTGTASTPIVGRGSNRGVANSDEVLYAYQGSAVSPTFLTAVANGGFGAISGSLNGSLTGTGLTAGVDALDLSTLDDDADIAAYTGPRTGEASMAGYRSLINNASNWIAQDASADQSADGTPPDLPFSSVAFTTTAAGTPTVTLSASATSGTEAGQTAITLTATASAPVAGDQTVAVSVAGTGITAGDYLLSATTITIPNGQASGSVTFTIVDDALVEGPETARVSLSNSSSGIALGSPAARDILIDDNDAAPAVTVAATDASAAENGLVTNTGSFTVTRTGDTTSALTVSFALSGSASSQSDYALTSAAALTATTVTIPAGQASVVITLTPVNDANRAEGPETATITLADGALYDLGAASGAAVTIADNTNGALRLTASVGSALGAEIPAFDPGSDRLYVVAGSAVEAYTLDAAGALAAAGTLAAGFAVPGGTQALPNSVAVSDGVLAIAYALVDSATGAQQPGRVAFHDAATGTFLNAVEVGFLPDMLAFTRDGTRLLTANEGEPNSYGRATSFDPEGSVSVIDLSSGPLAATVRTAGFAAFDSQAEALKAAGVRIFGPGASVSQDLEPEYLTFSADGALAYVTLQEANALAVVEIASATVTGIVPLGVKDHGLPGNGLDASDRDLSSSAGKIAVQNWPVVGLYQPDAIASFTVGGRTYLVTANEGDSRDYTGFSEEIRVGASGYVLDPTAFPDAATLKLNANLGRLQLTSATGDRDGDGDFDRIEAFGARSFSIWNDAGTLVYDSGDRLEAITASQVPGIFNSDGSFASPNFDSRSDNKGPEPEGVVIGTVANRAYAFVGLERTGDVVVFEVTDPQKPRLVEYVNVPGDVGVEGLAFVSAADSPTGKSLLVTTAEVSRTVSVFEFAAPVRIADIQGAGHVSPLAGKGVRDVEGIVTAKASNGFYLQDPYADTSEATSEGIFVFTGSNAPLLAARSVGEAVRVSGTVSEFRPGGNANNLTITQIGNNGSVQSLAVSAWTDAPAGGIQALRLGVDRTPPTETINDDFAVSGNVETAGDFDPATEGIDFYESLEGMWVQIDGAVATSPTARFGTSEEIWVLAQGGAGATSVTGNGGSLVKPGDFNPERIQIDDLINAGVALPDVDVGARLSTIRGVVSYDFNNYEVLVPSAPAVAEPSALAKETTALAKAADTMTVASFNVENLDPSDGPAKFGALAAAIVGNLRAPDVISLEEVQDNNGAVNDGTVAADLTLQTLVDAIAAAGGPTYSFAQIDPTNNQDGGEPGGNIRVAFLYNAERVSLVPGSLQRITDRDPGDGDAFANSRKPLAGTFEFNGETVTVIGNHFNSKGGDQPLFGPNQPPTLVTEAQRLQQAAEVKAFVEGLQAGDPAARVLVAGDLNDFEFSAPLTLLESAGLQTLTELLAASDRYTYNFQGNAQALDHMLANARLLTDLAGYDVVHMNSEYADQISDHDPLVAAFLLEGVGVSVAGSAARDVLTGSAGRDTVFGEAGSDILDGGAGRDRIDGGVGADWISGGAGRDTLTGGAGADRFVYASAGDGVDLITDFTPAGDRLAVAKLLASVGYAGKSPIVDGYLAVTAFAGGTLVSFDPDGSAGAAEAQPLAELAGVTLTGMIARMPGLLFDLTDNAMA